MARWDIHSGILNQPLRVELPSREAAERYGREKFGAQYRMVTSVASVEAAPTKEYGPPKEWPMERHTWKKPLFHQPDEDEDDGYWNGAISPLPVL